MKNIQWVENHNLCMSCATCIGACPQNALTINFSPNKTHYIPIVNDKLCNGCGICLDVCPGIKIQFEGKKSINHNIYIGDYHNVLWGYSTNDFIRKQCASGGVVTLLLLYILQKKIVDFVIISRMKKDGSLEPETIITDDAKEVIDCRGSIYCPLPLNAVFKDLDLTKKYALVGLPCHLMGLHYLENINPKLKTAIKYKFGLFCSRTPDFNATRNLLIQNKINPDEVKTIRYRGEGHPGYFQIQMINDEEKQIYHLSKHYWDFSFARYFMQYRCWLCPDKTAHYSDISFADDWTIPYKEDPLGRTTIVTRTFEGQELLNQAIEENIVITGKLNIERVVHTQALPKKMNINDRIKIAQKFNRKLPSMNVVTPDCENEHRNELDMFKRVILCDEKSLKKIGSNINNHYFIYKLKLKIENIIKLPYKFLIKAFGFCKKIMKKILGL